MGYDSFRPADNNRLKLSRSNKPSSGHVVQLGCEKLPYQLLKIGLGLRLQNLKHLFQFLAWRETKWLGQEQRLELSHKTNDFLRSVHRALLATPRHRPPRELQIEVHEPRI